MTKKTIAAGVVGLAVLASFSALAHKGATGIVKERMDQMSDMGKAMKVLKAELALGGPYNAEAVIAAAQTIESHSGAALTEKFPEGSVSKASEALPSVWTDWARFSALADDLEAYAGALEASASSGVPNDGGGATMGGMTDGGMMGGTAEATAPDPAMLATMAPGAVFARVAEVCSACHTEFRKKKESH